LTEPGVYWLQVWADQYRFGEILETPFQPKTNRQPPDLSVDGPGPEGPPNPADLHVMHAAQRSIHRLTPPAGSICYTEAELEAAGGTFLYAPEPHNPYHYNVQLRGLVGLTGGALRRARRTVKDELKRDSFDWTPDP